MKKCDVCGVDDGWIINSRKFNMVLCRKHYMKGMRTGDPFKRTRRTPNDITILDDYAEIVLRNNESKEVARTKISLDKVELAKKHKWHKSVSGYVVSFIGRKIIHLHKEIAGDPNFKEVDHINRDKLDNRNENLRPCTDLQNAWNRGRIPNKSGVRGVYYSNANKGWVAQITYKKKFHYLGTHQTMAEAVKARKEFELKIKNELFKEG